MAINLLPWREKKCKEKKQQLQIFFLLCLTITLVIWSFFSIKHFRILWQQKQEINLLQKQINTISHSYQNYLTVKNQRLQQLQQTLFLKNELAVDQALLQFLEQLAENMPFDMYLTQIQKKNNTLYFLGKSMSHAKITALLKRLNDLADKGQFQLTETSHPDISSPEIDFELIYHQTLK